MSSTLLLPAMTLFLTLAAPAQDAPGGTVEAQDSAAAETALEQDNPAEVEPTPAIPSTHAEAVARAAKLAKELERQPPPVVQGFLDAYIATIDEDLVELELLEASAAGNPDRMGETELRADVQTLISTADDLVKALSNAGQDVEEARNRLRNARETAAKVSTTEAGSLTRSRAIELNKEVLKARLRPMTLDLVHVELDVWLALLEATCAEISGKEIAGLQSTDAGQARFNEQAVLLRGQRGRLIERVNIVIAALDKKGGDSAPSKAYVSSVVAVPPITGVSAAITSLTAWVGSPDGGVAIGLELLRALVTVLVAFIISRIAGQITRRAMNRFRGSSALLRQFIVSCVEKGLILIGALMALSAMGVNMAPMVAAIGAAGLVLGLALQGTLGNLASGLMIMVFQPFDVDDIVDTAGAFGRVMGMTLMTTTIRTMDNRTIHVPNGMVWGDVITNVTANHTRRIDMVFGIGYGCDFARAREVLLEILNSHDKVLDDPEPNVRVHELADSSVNLITRPWVKTDDYWDVLWDVTENVKRRFDEEGIQIPFPQRDVHFYNESVSTPSSGKVEPT
ncbi:MAG: mechanosensitive ion channel family protein [Planctomycetota bacterium]|nr:mechanosensitive ion channel family protein [Planctomycetota bacterium]